MNLFDYNLLNIVLLANVSKLFVIKLWNYLYLRKLICNFKIMKDNAINFFVLV